jgi:tetratricopeptide (TPR) repeat protein
MAAAHEVFNAAVLAQRAGDYARAERLYRSIARSMPVRANHTLGVTLAAQGRFKAAEEAYMAALAADPTDARALYAVGGLRLAEGDFREGWRLWEERIRIDKMVRDPPRTEAPIWRGEDLAGKRILVAGEQGLGDHIMWARFLPELVRRGASVAFSATKVLHPIFRDLGVELVTQETEPVSGLDYWVLLTSLTERLGVTPETIPPPAPLSVPASTTGGGIGVFPAGNPENGTDRERSLFGRDAQRLLALGRDLRPEATGAKDFAETAAIIAGLDLVITVDTSVAHLAGSMGKPTWILVNAAGTDWRWGREGEDSRWYPSARLFRQRVAGDWAPVFRRLQTALAER